MIDDAEFNSLGDMVEASIMGARPVEEVQVELLWAILKELRSMRKSSDQMYEQFNRVSGSGTVLLMESSHG